MSVASELYIIVSIQLAIFAFKGEAATYYVTPLPRVSHNQTCSFSSRIFDPCYRLHDLQEALQDSGDSNVTLLFLAGVHRLPQHSSFSVHYKDSLTAAPLNSARVEINCSFNAIFIFKDIINLFISGLKFASCSLQYSQSEFLEEEEPSKQTATIINCDFTGRGSTYSFSFASVESIHIENSTFLGSNGAVWSTKEGQKTDSELVIANCLFLDIVRNATQTESDGPVNPFQSSDGTISVTGNSGGALHAQGANLIVSQCKFVNCTSTAGGAFYVENSKALIIDTTFEGNSAIQNGGAVLIKSSTAIMNTATFLSNTALELGGALYVYGNSFKSGLTISANTTFMFNSAGMGGALYCTSFDRTEIKIRNSYFAYNLARRGGSLYLVNSYIYLEESIQISNSTASDSGGALHVINSLVSYGLCSPCELSHNTAGKEGGALYLDTTPLAGNIYKPTPPEVIFDRNTVTSPQGKGGAIFVKDRDCEILTSHYHQCFAYNWNIAVPKKKLLFFTRNQASHGSLLYGGLLDRCLPPDGLPYKAQRKGIHDFKKIAQYSPSPLAITSQPLKLCLCGNKFDAKTDCRARDYNATKMPGEIIELRLAVLDQDENPVPAIIRASYTEVSAALNKGEGGRGVSDHCASHHYHIFTAESEAELVLEPVGPCRQSPLSTLRGHITMRPCARGFELRGDTCVCDRRLAEHLNISDCDINTLSMKPNGTVWLRYDDLYLKFSRNCPLAHCQVSANISFSFPDGQCVNHRSGILCGACQENHSIVLGTSKCLRCSITSIWLLTAFPIAGIALVALLLVSNINVSQGTLNGLIFYANIISISGLTKLHSCPIHPVLSVFISWLNLDLGIETCFYPGMDTYQQIWLQFCFPLYIWLLVTAIIVASHFSSTAMKVFGSNNIAILATLFLLSYNKILKTIITAITYTDILVSRAENYTDQVVSHRVWTYDGNVNYLQGKHTPLFVASLLFLLLLILPYTLMLMFGQRLRSMHVKGRRLSITRNVAFISIMDAYHAPYNRPHRYWTGLMLLTRCLLFLAFATYQQDQVLITNMFAVTLVVMGILTTKIYVRNIYKQLTIDILEAMFLLNLGILSATLYYLKGKGNTYFMCKVISSSISITLVTFVGILVYHVYFRVRKRKFCLFIQSRVYKIYKTKELPDAPSENTDMQAPQKVPEKLPTSTMVELREGLLASSSDFKRLQ